MRTLLTALLALSLGGCYYDVEEELYPNRLCDVSNVTFSGTVQPLIQGNCAVPGCHVAGSQTPDLSTYAGIKAAADAGALVSRAVQGDPSPMPPTGLLPDCDRRRIEAWVNAGAPNN